MESNPSKSQIKDQLRKRWAAEAVEQALMGRWDEAVQANLQVLEMFPDDVKAHNRLGKAYHELGRDEEAAAAYEQALQRQPSNPIARRNLAQLYAMLNREPDGALAATMLAEQDSRNDLDVEEDSGDD